MLVFQPLQPRGRDVVFERRPRFLAHRFSERALCSHLPICHDPILEGPRLGPDNSSHGERDVHGLDVAGYARALPYSASRRLHAFSAFGSL